MKDCPVVLGTPTLFRVMEVIKESEISELAVPWANSRLSWLMRGVHANAKSLKLVFSSSYAGCFLPCLLVLLFLRVGSLRLFLGMFVRGCARRDLC